MRPIINSVKHYVQFPQAGTAASGITIKTAAVAVAVVDKDAPNEVTEGSILKAVYFELWAINSDATQQFGTCTIEKIVSNGPAMTVTNANNLNTYLNKKNVLWTFEGLYPSSTDNPIPLIRQWIRIPKSKQRFGLGDRLVLNITAGGEITTSCGFMTYKEYT